MDARTLFLSVFAVLTGLQPAISVGAEKHETANFLVTAADKQVAEKVALTAEQYRKELAVYWLGRPMPNWSRPCRVSVNVGALGAGGQTTFQFVNGEVINWRMSVQGSLERILDSVIPHEVNHTIFACHFRRPLPRWADEGAATLFEHESEKIKQLHLLNQVIRDQGQHFSLRELLSMKDYPEDPRRMLTLYAQGFTLVDFLVQQKGQKVYLQLLNAAEEDGWEEAIRNHFDHEGIAALERNWRGWVLAGRPRLLEGNETLLADNSKSAAGDLQKPAAAAALKRSAEQPRAIVRSQSPDSEKSATVPAAVGTTAAAKAPARRTPPQGFRAASFEAPRPQPIARAAVIQEDASAESLDESQAGGETWFEETKRPSSGVGVDADPFEQLRSGAFVPTSHVDFQEDSERRDPSDDTPLWAGFPGSVKLF
jgi:hypothetical protein